MTYKIDHIEGIGSHYAERLGAENIRTTDDLMTQCATPEGRMQLGMKTGISTSQLLTWTHQADLMRVSGIGSEFGQLLETAGVESVKQLGMRDPENIAFLLERVNEEKKLTRVVPPVRTVSKWIDRARAMEPT